MIFVQVFILLMPLVLIGSEKTDITQAFLKIHAKKSLLPEIVALKTFIPDASAQSNREGTVYLSVSDISNCFKEWLGGITYKKYHSYHQITSLSIPDEHRTKNIASTLMELACRDYLPASISPELPSIMLDPVDITQDYCRITQQKVSPETKIFFSQPFSSLINRVVFIEIDSVPVGEIKYRRTLTDDKKTLFQRIEEIKIYTEFQNQKFGSGLLTYVLHTAKHLPTILWAHPFEPDSWQQATPETFKQLSAFYTRHGGIPYKEAAYNGAAFINSCYFVFPVKK